MAIFGKGGDEPNLAGGGSMADVRSKFSVDTSQMEKLVKGFSSIDRILTRHGVNHKQGFSWLNGLLERGNFIHHLLVNSQTTCGIDQHDIESIASGMLKCSLSNSYRVFLFFVRVYFNSKLVESLTPGLIDLSYFCI